MNEKLNTFPFMFSLLFSILTIVLFLAGCTSKPSELYSKQQIFGEIAKLNHLNSIGNLSEKDFVAIHLMLANDSYANDELKEIETMSKYKEYEHVFHGLSFLQDYINTSTQVICPGHSLAHYYIFKRHNEKTLASKNLEDVINDYPVWIRLVNSAPNFNETLNRIKTHIALINSGNTTASDDDIEWLATDGSICIQEPKIKNLNLKIMN